MHKGKGWFMNLTGSSCRCSHYPEPSLWEMTGTSAPSLCFGHPDPEGQSGNPVVRPLSQTSGVCPALSPYARVLTVGQHSAAQVGVLYLPHTRVGPSTAGGVRGRGFRQSRPSPGQTVPSGCQKECKGAGQLWGWGFCPRVGDSHSGSAVPTSVIRRSLTPALSAGWAQT